MPRNLDTIGYWIFITKLVLLLLMCTPRGFGFPANGHDQFVFSPDADKGFYDSNILPESREVTRYLIVNSTEKVFFIPQGNNTPIYITITPCASKVEWTVSHKSIVTYTSGDTEDNTVNFPTAIKPVPKTLYKYSGSEQHTFSLQSGEVGFYTVDIKSTESDSYVRFYGTTVTLPYSKIYPSLPIDSSIKVKKLKRKSFTVEWTSSPDETPFDNIIEYAVSVNRRRPYSTHCSVMSHLRGDKKPRPPKFAGFGFPSETERDKMLKEKANPVKPVTKGEISYYYIGRKTRFTFNSARPGRLYYIDVFAFDIKTNRTVHYKSLSLRTKRGKKKSKGKRLKDGRMELVSLKKPKETVTYVYKLKKQTKEVLLAIHSCSGKVNIKISSNNKKKIFRKRVKDMKTFTLKDLPKGVYLIQVRNSKKGRKNVRLFLTKKPDKFHYPKIPKDATLKVVNTTCSNVTIAWTGDTDKQTFCIYKTELSASVRKKRKRNRYDQCVSETDKNSELVECMNFRHHKFKPLLQKVISGLKPNAFYKIDIHVKRRGKNQRNTSLRYESLHIQTLDDVC